MPVPAGLVLPNSNRPCTGRGAYPADWVSGVAQEPGWDKPSALLITFNSFCVTSTTGFSDEGFGMI